MTRMICVGMDVINWIVYYYFMITICHTSMHVKSPIKTLVSRSSVLSVSSQLMSRYSYTEKKKHDSVASGKEWFMSEEEN